MSETSTRSAAGDSAILAKRYVDALFELAEPSGAVDTLLSDFANLQSLWKESAEWRFIASDPRLPSDATTEAVATVAAAASFHKLTANFLAVLAQNHRLNLLPALVERFIDVVSAKRGEFRADVRAARPLSDNQRRQLSTLLAAAIKGKIRLSLIEDPSIIGGLTIKVGSRFIDASVKTKLDLLERNLKEARETA